MDYSKFSRILNKKIFGGSKFMLKFMEKLSESPERYVGFFRPTKPKTKIIQNITQSHEVKFGDAFEMLIEEYLKENGFEILEKKFGADKNSLNLDQHFRKDKKEYFVEQKIRDDHDSSKKGGQMDNFEKKLIKLTKDSNEEKCLTGIFYFVDPSLKKNRKYYFERLEEMKNRYKIELFLFYGEELFNHLGMDWEEVLKHLEKWKSELPEIPEINFDEDAEGTFAEIKDLPPKTFMKIFSNEKIFKEIVLTLFPQKKVLNLLLKHFEEKSDEPKYKDLFDLLNGLI